MGEPDLSEIACDSIRSILLETIAQHLGTKNCRIKLDAASKQGDNFIGIVQRVTYNTVEEDTYRMLILKTAPTNPARRQRFFSRPCFLREIYLYNEVLPYFQQFQQTKGVIVDENGFSELPKCYRTYDVEPNECLLLEDLTANGFSMMDRRTDALTANHVKLVMQTIGKFHAISFAMKDQEPEKLKELTSDLNEILLRTAQPEMVDFFKMLGKTLINAVDKDLADKVEKALANDPLAVAVDCVSGMNAEPYAVICHGDCWSNNTMFKHNEQKTPIEVSLIDWQISRYASPVTDLLYYLFSCTTKELRDNHYDEFLRIYHESLSNHLKRLGSDPEKLFPYETLLDQFKKFGKFGMIMASMLLPMMTSQDGIAADLDEFAEQLKDGQKLDENTYISERTRHILDKRLRDVVIDMARLEYI